MVRKLMTVGVLGLTLMVVSCKNPYDRFGQSSVQLASR